MYYAVIIIISDNSLSAVGRFVLYGQSRRSKRKKTIGEYTYSDVSKSLPVV